MTTNGMRILSTEEVAKILDCSTQAVEIAARKGRLPGVQYGRAWMFPETALLDALHKEAMANAAKSAAPRAANDPSPTVQPAAESPHKRKPGRPARPRPNLPMLTG